MLVLIGAGFLIFPPISYLLSKGNKVPLFDELAEQQLREGEKELPGKSAYLFFISLVPALIIFDWRIVMTGVVGASFVDTASTIVGFYKGKKKIVGSKTWEGFLAGLLFAGLAMTFFLGFWKAFAVAAILALTELIPTRELLGFDDNLILPLAASYLIWIL